jgi:hypothetical protein
MAALLAWRSVFEIVNPNETPASVRRRDKRAVINGDLRIYGAEAAAPASFSPCGKRTTARQPDPNTFQRMSPRWADAPLFADTLR